MEMVGGCVDGCGQMVKWVTIGWVWRWSDGWVNGFGDGRWVCGWVPTHGSVGGWMGVVEWVGGLGQVK